MWYKENQLTAGSVSDVLKSSSERAAFFMNDSKPMGFGPVLSVVFI